MKNNFSNKMGVQLTELLKIVDSVRDDLRSSQPTLPNQDPLTLKGLCQDGAHQVLKLLSANGHPNARVFRLLLPKREGSLGGVHLVAECDGYIADPAITQYFPHSRKFIWAPDKTYPLDVVEARDITNDFKTMYDE